MPFIYRRILKEDNSSPMKPKFRAYSKIYNQLCNVVELTWDDEGNISNALLQLTKPQIYGNLKVHTHDDFELMQYTGLHDKHNTEIYDGDIVQYTDLDYHELNSVGVVKYNPPEFGFDDDATFWTPYEPNDYEIIGNVYANPELIP